MPAEKWHGAVNKDSRFSIMHEDRKGMSVKEESKSKTNEWRRSERISTPWEEKRHFEGIYNFIENISGSVFSANRPTMRTHPCRIGR